MLGPPYNTVCVQAADSDKTLRSGAHSNQLQVLNSTLISPVLTSIWAGEAQPADVLPGLCEDVDAYLAEHSYGA